jgi:hypothetical protein
MNSNIRECFIIIIGSLLMIRLIRVIYEPINVEIV